MKTYTEDEFTCRCSEAVALFRLLLTQRFAEIQASLDALTAASEQSEVDSAIAEVQASLMSQKLRLLLLKPTLADTISYLESAVAAGS